MSVTSSTVNVLGSRRGAFNLTGRVGTGRPLVTWCRNGSNDPRGTRRQATSDSAKLTLLRAWKS